MKLNQRRRKTEIKEIILLIENVDKNGTINEIKQLKLI